MPGTAPPSAVLCRGFALIEDDPQKTADFLYLCLIFQKSYDKLYRYNACGTICSAMCPQGWQGGDDCRRGYTNKFLEVNKQWQ